MTSTGFATVYSGTTDANGRIPSGVLTPGTGYCILIPQLIGQLRYLTTCFTYPGGAYTVTLLVNTDSFVCAPLGCPYPVSRKMTLAVNASSDGCVVNSTYTLTYYLQTAPHYLEGWFLHPGDTTSIFVATGYVGSGFRSDCRPGSEESPIVVCTYVMPGVTCCYCPSSGPIPILYAGGVTTYEPTAPFAIQLSYSNNSQLGCMVDGVVILQSAAMREDLS